MLMRRAVARRRSDSARSGTLGHNRIAGLLHATGAYYRPTRCLTLPFRPSNVAASPHSGSEVGRAEVGRDAGRTRRLRLDVSRILQKNALEYKQHAFRWR